MDHIKAVFGPHYHGHVQGKRGSLVLGREENEFGPYDLVLAGLSGCFYLTFLSITEKMQLSYREVTIDIQGHHRKDPPTTLEHVVLDMTVEGADISKEKQFRRATEIAGKYCSVYQTLSHVAEIETKLTLLP
ncbi:MAG TPA: OsmC family protein [Bacillota bacterium]|jgi:putative redox protein|nr:OsmC family protein [Fastidiosipila sp.]HPX92686.1 OsmC family protein [Bacillota bacterium]HQB80583.1 OsmC family protein [Bacillota bacterium]